MEHLPNFDDAEIETGNDFVKDRRFVTALARGLDVLRCFKPGDTGLGNLEIARRTGIPKPTISRLTFTLTQLGYLRYDDQHGFYRLGPGVLSLGYAMLSGLNIRERARPLMQELANRLDATIAIGNRDQTQAVYLEVCRGPGAVMLRIDVGHRNPIAPTAMGRALLSIMSGQERERCMAQVAREMDDSAEFARLSKAVENAVNDVAERGYCLSLGDWQTDVNAVGVPLVDYDQNVYSLICGGPAFKLSRAYLEDQCGPQLVALARKIPAIA